MKKKIWYSLITFGILTIAGGLLVYSIKRDLDNSLRNINWTDYRDTMGSWIGG